MIRSRSRTPCKTKAPCVTSEEVLCCRALHLALSIDIPVDQVLQDITHLGSQVVDLNGSKPFKIFYGLGYPRRDFEYSQRHGLVLLDFSALALMLKFWGTLQAPSSLQDLLTFFSGLDPVQVGPLLTGWTPDHTLAAEASSLSAADTAIEAFFDAQDQGTRMAATTVSYPTLDIHDLLCRDST